MRPVPIELRGCAESPIKTAPHPFSCEASAASQWTQPEGSVDSKAAPPTIPLCADGHVTQATKARDGRQETDRA